MRWFSRLFVTLGVVALAATPVVRANLGVGDPAADFNLLSQFNTYYHLFDYQGDIIVLDFSIMMCQDCRVEAVDLQQNYWEPYQDQGVMVFCLLGEDSGGSIPDLADLNEWANDLGLTYPILSEPGPSRTTYGVSSYPTNFIIDRSMTIRYRNNGYDHTRMMQAFLDLLDEDTPTPITTPVPTDTPFIPCTPTPSPTPDPMFEEISLEFTISDTYFQENDTFLLSATMNSANVPTIVDFYAVLDVYGLYFFYPAWSETLTAERLTVPAGMTGKDILGPFSWPPVDGMLTNLGFYGILTGPDDFTILSTLAFVEFGYGP
ncbi:redoxin domain-containing protein [bacterium]|nr:redoxin domain-containing protein [candidate division CSSED10-310 bacterium]